VLKWAFVHFFVKIFLISIKFFYFVGKKFGRKFDAFLWEFVNFYSFLIFVINVEEMLKRLLKS